MFKNINGKENLIRSELSAILLFLFFAVFFTLFFYQKNIIEKNNVELSQNYSQIRELLQIQKSFEKEIFDTKNKLEKYIENYDELEEDFDKIDDDLDDLKDAVETAQKIQNTDPELLQKYSKVYFLNEHYVPEKLRKIDEDYLLFPEKNIEIHSGVRDFLENLLEDAEDENLNLKILSAYRSFDFQEALKDVYTQNYGSAADNFSADQGFSEHQLGTSVDFTTSKIASSLIGFENTEEYLWLLENAYKYGFVLSYPKNNIYYEFEPWHWRFVGEKLAKYLNRKDLNFYDLEQREIDEYVEFFLDD